ncbi:uncharacterized protein LOC112194494 [Rosa chinensis]|nr:uncharacterized protein LOC112194494 [Rosa chinensis]
MEAEAQESSPQNDAVITSFYEITSASKQEALFFLEFHNYDLDAAVSTFLDNENAAADAAAAVTVTNPVQLNSTTTTSPMLLRVSPVTDTLTLRRRGNGMRLTANFFNTELPGLWRNTLTAWGNEKEFVEDAAKEYDESTINCASELGLLEQNAKEKLLFVQLPPTLPLVKRPTSAKGKEKVGSSAPSEKVGAARKGGSLEELSEGYMGKMLVYKSGAVKFKLGDALYDVSPGSDCIFSQDVAAINTAARKCCVLGELGQRVVITPDVDSLLDATIELD